MKKYLVWIPFQGSLSVEVMAENEEDALRIGEREIEKIDAEDVLNQTEWDNYEVEEIG